MLLIMLYCTQVNPLYCVRFWCLLFDMHTLHLAYDNHKHTARQIKWNLHTFEYQQPHKQQIAKLATFKSHILASKYQPMFVVEQYPQQSVNN